MLRTHRSQARGFTLIELMMVLAIISVLALIATPSYTQYVKKGHRSVAAQTMLTIQNREEQYILDARTYTDVVGPTGLNIVHEGLTCAGTACTNSFYSIAVTIPHPTLPAPSYLITATALGNQTSDGNLTLTSAGTRARSAGDGKW